VKRSSAYALARTYAARVAGGKFFHALSTYLREYHAIADDPERADLLLCNVSTTLAEIVRARLRGNRVALRVDGRYVYRLTPSMVAHLPRIVRWTVPVAQWIPVWSDALASLANAAVGNWRVDLRMRLAYGIIFQSAFARDLAPRWATRKPHVVIHNAALQAGEVDAAPFSSNDSGVRLVATYVGDRAEKRLIDAIRFVEWCNATGRSDVTLTNLGYGNEEASRASPELRYAVEASDHVRTSPRFETVGATERSVVRSSHMYMHLAQRDAFPNAVIEAMAHGLPVIGLDDGGMREVVGDAGVLVPAPPHPHGRFAAALVASDLPALDDACIATAMDLILVDLDGYRIRALRRAHSDLAMGVIANQYDATVRRWASE